MSLTPRIHPTGQGRLAASRPLVRGVTALVLGLMVSACVEETSSVSIAPAKGASAESAVESFVITVATADVIGERCGRAGIARNYSSMDALLDSYLRNLGRAGYSPDELVRAVDGLSEDRVGDAAIARLRARGVRDGDIGSLCRYGRDEIARGTAVGKLLKVTT